MVPYCKTCGDRLNRDRQRTWSISAVLAILIVSGSWLWIRINEPEGHEFLGTASLIALPLIWPIYSVFSHRRRALSVRWYNGRVVDVRVKNSVYAEALKKANSE
jgi:uncharacterized membrane protein